MERLPRPPTAQQSHDGCGRGLHPPLPATRLASRLSTYPLLRIPGQLPSPNQTGSLPPIVSRSLLPTPTVPIDKLYCGRSVDCGSSSHKRSKRNSPPSRCCLVHRPVYSIPRRIRSLCSPRFGAAKPSNPFSYTAKLTLFTPSPQQ